MATKKSVRTISSSQVREARRLSGLTQKAAAELLGFSVTSLARWETGFRAMAPELFDVYVKLLQDHVDSKNPNFNKVPTAGSVWTHRKGDGYEYTVVLVTSEPDRAHLDTHPVTVVYKSATTGKVWPLPLVKFHQSFVEKPFKIATSGKAVSQRDKFKPAAKPVKKPIASRKTPRASNASWPFPSGTVVPASASNPLGDVTKELNKSTAKKPSRAQAAQL